MLRSVFRLKKKATEPIGFIDLNHLDRVANVSLSLTRSLPPGHPSFKVAKSLQKTLLLESFRKQPTIQLIDTLQIVEEEPKKFSIDNEQFENVKSIEMMETSFRIILLRQYLRSLQQILQTHEIPHLNESQLASIIDSYMVGSSKDRITNHLLLYSPQFSPIKLQDCFYRFAEPEIEATRMFLQQFQGIHSQHNKLFPQFCRNFLLDRFDLNTKSRCVFAWSDPLNRYQGFKTLEESEKVSLGDVIRGRERFFPEACQLATHLLLEYTNHSKNKYEDRRKSCSFYKNGMVFVLGTCLADWLVCSL